MITHREKSVDADVLGPAYSFNQPSPPQAGAPELVQTLRQSWDAAATVWAQSMQTALRAPFSFGPLMWGGLDRTALNPTGQWRPDFGVTRQGNSVKVSAMLPGATQDDVEVEILNGKLVISGECNFSEHDGSSDHFSESIDLMNAVDSHSVEARIDEEGFLEISLKLHDPSGQLERSSGQSTEH
ncbi:Hsp20/alpha crystallin family protein [Aquabacterium sp.]|uniref:Hsp20/alpha crystallin family protein n=1 Tax=Aquabacterium sp. TaxID=1872578 RepID=UPI003D6D8CAD